MTTTEKFSLKFDAERGEKRAKQISLPPKKNLSQTNSGLVRERLINFKCPIEKHGGTPFNKITSHHSLMSRFHPK